MKFKKQDIQRIKWYYQGFLKQYGMSYLNDLILNKNLYSNNKKYNKDLLTFSFFYNLFYKNMECSEFKQIDLEKLLYYKGNF